MKREKCVAVFGREETRKEGRKEGRGGEEEGVYLSVWMERDRIAQNTTFPSPRRS